MARQAVILAGGFGTRLAHVVSDVPKPMAPINEKPFLEYIIETLKKQNFDSFVFLTGYKSEFIESYFKNLNNAIFIKEEKALGTGGAILNAFSFLHDEFFLINGDTFFDIDYSLMEDFSEDKAFTIALRYTNNVERYGFVDLDDNFNVKSFVEKGNLPENKIDGFINGGIYYIKKSSLNTYVENYNGEFISLESDIFPQLLEQRKLSGLPLGGCFIDIGIPDDYYRAQKLIPEWIQKEQKPALFIDKDGTIIENTEYPHGKNINIFPQMVEYVRSFWNQGYHIIMITNQAGIAKAKFTFEGMQEGFKTILDYYSERGIEFTGIEFCPYHKDGVIKDFKYDSLLRKPNPGMILKACEEFKIDLRKSQMIGDNPDIDKIKLPYLKCNILEEI